MSMDIIPSREQLNFVPKMFWAVADFLSGLNQLIAFNSLHLQNGFPRLQFFNFLVRPFRLS